MKDPANIPLVTTIKERCRSCYTCIRECPAKAIRVAEGQAEVLAERCIGCGNCVRVCSQNAKQVVRSVERVAALLAETAKVAAIIAPSFPAEFTDMPWRRLVGRTRALGFDWVNEVAFGADLVAKGYRQWLDADTGERHIATSCPAVVAYVERYHPEMVDRLSPLVSPMVASARALRRLHDDDIRVVFIGPCIAKKGEACSELLPDEIDAALTFVELREMLAAVPDEDDSDFDPPHAGAGAFFPISRGMLQAAELREDLVDGRVVATDGRSNFVEALREFESGDLDANLLEVLACNGCIMGPGVSGDAPLFSRRARVSEFVRERMATFDRPQWRSEMDQLADLNLTRTYRAYDQRIPVPFEEEIRLILQRMGKSTPEDELNCGACGYDTCREHAIAVFKGLAETEMCLPHTIEQLATTQEALMHSEKLASMGQLAAGIAHEVNNPLGVVLMYSHLLLDEAKDDSKLRDDLQLIAGQADRCKKIVSGLLNFARQSKVLRRKTDIRQLTNETVRALPVAENIKVDVRHEADNPMAELDPDQIAQVLINLATNACAAMADGGKLTVTTTGDSSRVKFTVTDTGCGIPEESIGKIFEPFFTTKQIGKGTGLGLSVTYGIVKMHGGDIQVQSNAEIENGPTGTTFTVAVPRTGPQE